MARVALNGILNFCVELLSRFALVFWYFGSRLFVHYTILESWGARGEFICSLFLWLKYFVLLGFLVKCSKKILELYRSAI